MLSDREFLIRTQHLANTAIGFVLAPLTPSGEQHITNTHPWIELRDEARDRLNTVDVAAEKPTMPDEVEAVAKPLAEHRIPMCRARLLHCLAAAAEQGTLQEVLDELLVDSNFASHAVADDIVETLRLSGWMSPKKAPPKKRRAAR